MNWWLLIIIPVTSAFIGWFTNRLSIKILFHPQKPIRIAGFTIQGIFPKYQQPFAQKLGALVSTELFSFTEIEEKITSPDSLKKIMPVVETHVDEFLRHRLKEAFPMIGMFIGEKTINSLKEVFMKELENIFPVIMRNYVQNLQQEINIEQLVATKVAAFPLNQLESMLHQNLSKQLRMAGIMGAVIGLLIGLVQAIIVIAIS
jgi:uncharacterized membrane protein YheB (UPF0754 family)